MPILTPDATLPYVQQMAAQPQGSFAANVLAGAKDDPDALDKIARILFWGANGADWATTAWNQAHGYHEQDPLYNFAGEKAAVPISAAINVGGYLLAQKLLKNHPHLLDIGLLGNAAIHGEAAAENIKGYQKYGDQRAPGGPFSLNRPRD